MSYIDNPWPRYHGIRQKLVVLILLILLILYLVPATEAVSALRAKTTNLLHFLNPLIIIKLRLGFLSYLQDYAVKVIMFSHQGMNRLTARPAWTSRKEWAHALYVARLSSQSENEFAHGGIYLNNVYVARG